MRIPRFCAPCTKTLAGTFSSMGNLRLTPEKGWRGELSSVLPGGHAGRLDHRRRGVGGLWRGVGRRGWGWWRWGRGGRAHRVRGLLAHGRLRRAGQDLRGAEPRRRGTPELRVEHDVADPDPAGRPRRRLRLRRGG